MARADLGAVGDAGEDGGGVGVLRVGAGISLESR